MSKINFYVRVLLLFVIVLGVSGCGEDPSPYIIESTIDLQNPNGIYEVLLFKASQEAFSKIDWGRYENKKIFYEVQEITNGYLDNVVAALLTHKFSQTGGTVLVLDKTGENEGKPELEIKKAIDYDYDLYITLPISGIYYYEGFFKRNYVAYTMINLLEIQKDGVENIVSSGIIEKRFDKFIPSKIFVASMWILILAASILLMIKILMPRKMNI